MFTDGGSRNGYLMDASPCAQLGARRAYISAGSAASIVRTASDAAWLGTGRAAATSAVLLAQAATCVPAGKVPGARVAARDMQVVALWRQCRSLLQT